MGRRPEELAQLSIGALLGTAVAALIAPLVRPLFHAPAGMVGYLSVHGYPKNWDVAVVALIVIFSFAGALVVARRCAPQQEPPDVPRPRWAGVAIAVFLLACAIHDLPNEPLDFYHEGEHLTPAFLLRSGGQPYRDVYFDHGFASDGGLDLLVLGDPPSLVRTRRLATVLGAATLALLAPIAAEVCATSAGVALAVFASFCAIGGGVTRLFGYYRLAPLLIAALALLRYLRNRRTASLAVAITASTAGVLWSLDIGMYAVTGTIVLAVALRAAGLANVTWAKLIAIMAAAALIPVVILLAVRADLHQFFVDSYVTIPKVAWVVWSLPQPDPPHLRDFLFWLADDPGRYYVPLVVYGLALAIAARRWRAGARVDAARIAVIVTFALLLFRSAAGRVDANHTRFAMPLVGIAVVASILEPLATRGRMIGTIAAASIFILVLDVIPNVTGTVDSLRVWPARHDGSRNATSEAAADLAALNAYVSTFGPEATILDVSNSEAVYFLLGRKAAARNLEVMMWSAPSVFADEMRRLRARPPACVIVQGYAETLFDGLSMSERVPQLFQWIDANYPRRVRFGRFVVATK